MSAVKKTANAAPLLVSLVAAIILGPAGFFLFFFADLAGRETLTGRFIGAAAFFAISGFVVGFVDPRRWALSGVLAWATVLGGVCSLLAVPPPGDSRVVEVSVRDGKLELSSATIDRGTLTIRMTNQGSEDHHLAVVAIEKDEDLEQLRQGRLTSFVPRATFKRLAPGESYSAVMGDYFQPGRYALVCYLPSLSAAHTARGEWVEFTVR